MAREDTDILISGAGIAGLVAAAAFGAAGFRVIVADPARPSARAEDPGADLRSTAYLQPALDLLGACDLWQALAPHAQPLDALRVIDTAGWPPEIRAERTFLPADVGHDSFGANLPNWRTRALLVDRIAGMERVDLRLGTRVAGMTARAAEAIARLDTGDSITARLIVAADGRDSPVRQMAGIGERTTRYGQKAHALAVHHDLPHDNVSTEIYNQGGAFTIVPMPDHDGRPTSGVVWMEDGPTAAETHALDDADLAERMTRRSAAVLGRLEPAGPRQMWPIVTRIADRMIAPRVALVAEAAHVMPPIGAQGLNTSLHDIRLLRDLVAEAPDDLGSEAMLARYARARARDVHLRARAIDLFNRVCRSGLPPVQALRSAGLRSVHDLAPLRRAVMARGMGTR